MSGGGAVSRTGIEASNDGGVAPSGRDVAVGVVVTALVVSGATAPASLDAGVAADLDAGCDRASLGDALPSLPVARLAAIALLGSTLLLGGVAPAAGDGVGTATGADLRAVAAPVPADDGDPSRPIQRRANVETVGYEVAHESEDVGTVPAVV